MKNPDISQAPEDFLIGEPPRDLTPEEEAGVKFYTCEAVWHYYHYEIASNWRRCALDGQSDSPSAVRQYALHATCSHFAHMDPEEVKRVLTGPDPT